MNFPLIYLAHSYHRVYSQKSESPTDLQVVLAFTDSKVDVAKIVNPSAS